MKLQIRINNENKTTFTHSGNNFIKTYINDEEIYVTFFYKSLKGMMKAASKLITKDSIIINI